MFGSREFNYLNKSSTYSSLTVLREAMVHMENRYTENAMNKSLPFKDTLNSEWSNGII